MVRRRSAFSGDNSEFAERVVMPCTHGRTREEAIRHGEDVIEMYLEAWQAEGEFIPAPKTLQLA